jgi:mannose-6-phosphate isomerase-like protein (cupin superfamily)
LGHLSFLHDLSSLTIANIKTNRSCHLEVVVKKTYIPGLKPIAKNGRDSLLFEGLGLTGAIEYPHFSIAKTVLKPGATVEKHYHKKPDEIYLVTNGKGQMQVNEDAMILRAGDLLLIQPNDWHQLTAVGDDDLEFYAITRPAYSPDDYLTE